MTGLQNLNAEITNLWDFLQLLRLLEIRRYGITNGGVLCVTLASMSLALTPTAQNLVKAVLLWTFPKWLCYSACQEASGIHTPAVSLTPTTASPPASGAAPWKYWRVLATRPFPQLKLKFIIQPPWWATESFLWVFVQKIGSQHFFSRKFTQDSATYTQYAVSLHVCTMKPADAFLS